MSCEKGDGPQVGLNMVDALTRRRFNGREWHDLRKLAYDDAVRDAWQEESQQRVRNPEESAYDRAVKRVKESGLMSKQRASDAEIEKTANRLFTTLNKYAEERFGISEREQRERNAVLPIFINSLKEAEPTRGTIAALDGLAKRGMKSTLIQMRNMEQSRRDAAQVVRDLKEAADNEPDPRMAEALRVAASKVAKTKDENTATWWARSDEAKETYPGLDVDERITLITRGDAEARKMGMFSRRGNEAVLAAGKKMQEDIRAGRLDKEGVSHRMDLIYREIAPNHPEVFDTEPRSALTQMAAEAGGWDYYDF